MVEQLHNGVRVQPGGFKQLQVLAEDIDVALMQILEMGEIP